MLETPGLNTGKKYCSTANEWFVSQKTPLNCKINETIKKKGKKQLLLNLNIKDISIIYT